MSSAAFLTRSVVYYYSLKITLFYSRAKKVIPVGDKEKDRDSDKVRNRRKERQPREI